MRAPLAWKIGCWLGVVFALVVYVGWHMVMDFNALHREARFIETVNHESHYLHELEMALVHTIAPVRSYLISGDWRLPDAFARKSAHMRHLLHASVSGRVRDLHLERSLAEITVRAKHIFSLPFPVGNLEGPILMREIDDIVNHVSQRLSARHDELHQGVVMSMRKVGVMRKDMRTDFQLSILLLFFILTGMTMWLYMHMVRPLVHLQRELKKVGRGEFDIHCPRLPMDELGELAQACNLMGEALQTREAMLNHARNMAAHHEKMRALGLMAAGIAHEVGNPLSATSVSLETALRGLERKNYEKCREGVLTALEELKRMESIIRNILDYGAVNNETSLTRIDAVPVARSAFSLARMSPQRRQVDLKFEIESSSLFARGNASILRQVLVNLLLNAMDACSEEGCVSLKATRLDGGIALDVSDNGPGVPEHMREEIFTPLFTTKCSGSGSGVGLAISRELMQRMHGKLELVHSDGRGSRFRAWLPAG